MFTFPEQYSEPYQTSKTEHFAKIVNDYKLLFVITNAPF